MKRYDDLSDLELASLQELFTDEYGDLVPILPAGNTTVSEQIVCDCGSFKTYKTMEPEAHVDWCSSRNQGRIK